MKMLFKKLVFLFSFILVPVLVNSQEKNELITRIKAQLFIYKTQNSIQAITIQTDKSLYRPGEELWFHGYVTDVLTGKLSVKSREFIVKMIDYKGNVINSVNCGLKNGMAFGSLSLSSDPGSNLYSLVAWTPEMDNGSTDQIARKDIYIARPENFNLSPKIEYPGTLNSTDGNVKAVLRLQDFSGKPLSGERFNYKILSGGKEIISGKGKTTENGSGEIKFTTPATEPTHALVIDADIPAGNERINLVSHIPRLSENIDVKFFPEGGKIIPGIPQRIVFKATDQLGNPVNVNADIVNVQGEILVKTTSIQTGLGLFNMINPENSGYKLKITSDLGKGQVIALPAADTTGMSISVNKIDGQNIDLLLARHTRSTHSKFLVLTLNHGEVNWASEFELGQTGIIKIPMDIFDSEIGAVAVFNSNGTLAGQRLIFTGKSKQINVLASPDKLSYSKGEEGNIKVKLTRPDGSLVRGGLLVSISDNTSCKVTEDMQNGLDYGLEKPLIFDVPLDMANKTMLDYNLIANHLKGFDWDKILSVDPSNPRVLKSNIYRISGKVIDSRDNPVSNLLVRINGSALQQFKAMTNERGDFFTDISAEIEKKNLSFTATNVQGKGKYRVRLNQSFEEEVLNSLGYSERVNEWKYLEAFQQSGYFKANPDFLKANPLGNNPTEDSKTRVPFWKKYLEGSGTVIDAVKMIKPCEIINGMIVFRGGSSINFQDGALIVVDEQKMGSDASLLSQMDPKIVDDIKVLLDPSEISRYTGFNSVGVIVITTKRGGPTVKDVPAEDASQKDKSNGLFTPHPIGNKKYNLLTTLQWIPNLLTDDNGEATIRFTTGNIKSIFILKIAGFTDRGEWFEKEAEIPVR